MLRDVDGQGAMGMTAAVEVGARSRGMLRRALVVIVAASATIAMWPTAAPASHPPYPDSPLGTAQAGMMLLTSEPFCGADYGPQGEHRSELGTHGGDIAFWESRAVLACGADDDDIENDGFVVLDIADPAHPVKLGEFRCVASASDIGIWGDLVFLAVDRNSEAGYITQPGPHGDRSCSVVDLRRRTSTFAGVHIVSIADPGAPVLVKSVATTIVGGAPRGAHNITVVPDLGYREEGAEEPRVLVYAAFPRSVHQDVVAVPLHAPGAAVVKGSIPTPGLHMDTGFPREGVPEAPEDVPAHYPDTTGCHDISFFLPRGLATCHALSAVGSSVSGTILWDVRDDPDDDNDDGASLLAPKVVSQITSITSAEAGFPGRRDHSSAFSWDGNTLVISDENVNGLATGSCDPAQSVLWFYDIRDPYAPALRGKQAAHLVAGNGWCPSKQISVVPLLDGRDVLIASWLGGGTTVVDFTDPGRPRQVGVFVDFLGIEPSGRIDPLGNRAAANDVSLAWASYWYAGHVFINNAWGCARPRICFGSKFRGLDVLTLNGIRASTTARLRRFNFGTQECLPPLHSRRSCG